MLQHGRKHTPAHALAELDHACSEAVARLREGLDETPRSVVFPGDGVDGEFVAEVSELEGGIEAAVDTCSGDFGGRTFRKDLAAVAPGQSSMNPLRLCDV